MKDRITVTIDSNLADLIPGFLDNRRRDVDKLKALLATSNFADIRLIGHSMKGAGGGYGFDTITEIGAAIERAALDADIAGVQDARVRLIDYLARVDVVFGE